MASDLRSLWTLRLLAATAAAGLSALRGAAALPAPAYAATGVAVGDDLPTLAYAGAGTLRNGLYTSVYDNFGRVFHSHWPLGGPWNDAELPPWRPANALRINWVPGMTRREVPTHTPVDLRTALRCEWKLLPGSAAVSVPVGASCSPVQEETQDHVGRALPKSPHHHTAEEPAAPESEASAVKTTTTLPPYVGEAAQLVMQQTGSQVNDQQVDDPISGDGALDIDVPAARSRRRRQVSRWGRRGASSAAAAAASASSGPWGSSASAAAASAASGGRRRPAYGYRPGYYGRMPAYGRPFHGPYYG